MRSRTTTFSSQASPLGQVSDVDTSVTWPGVGLQSGSDFRGTNPLKINHFPSVLLLPYFSGLTLPRGQNHPHLFENRPTHTHTHTHTCIRTYTHTPPSKSTQAAGSCPSSSALFRCNLLHYLIRNLWVILEVISVNESKYPEHNLVLKKGQ